MVFGDFDADGLTGLAVLTLALRAFGVEVLPYVPSRLDEGHGLSMAAVDAAEQAGARVHRHGRHGHDEHRRDRRSTGPRDRRPRHRSSPRPVRTPQCRRDRQSRTARRAATRTRACPAPVLPSPLGRLLLGDGPEAFALAELATIGTIADVAPILGENRSIVRLGLERMRHVTAPGDCRAPVASQRCPGRGRCRDRCHSPSPPASTPPVEWGRRWTPPACC